MIRPLFIPPGARRAAAARALPVLALCSLAALGCSGKKRKAAPPAEPPPTAIDTLVVHKVAADVSKPDPAAAYWQGLAEGEIVMTAQPMVAPRPDVATTEKVFVKAVTDGKLAAFRIRWRDPERSMAGRLGEFSDALALEFPVKTDPLPPVMMGAAGAPVHIFHWRAQYQRDHEEGKPTIATLYPNASIDMYPMEFKDQPGAHEAGREQFSPGAAVGNPQSYAKGGVDEIIAEGYSTSSVQPAPRATPRTATGPTAVDLAIVRPLATEGGSNLARASAFIAFAAWQGGKLEVGSRKCVTMAWLPVSVQ
jgi:hypothetical protein